MSLRGEPCAKASEANAIINTAINAVLRNVIVIFSLLEIVVIDLTFWRLLRPTPTDLPVSLVSRGLQNRLPFNCQASLSLALTLEDGIRQQNPPRPPKIF